MEANKILNADLLDIIFEGRNKEYGAYFLRKNYQQRLFIAIACMVALVALFVILQTFARSRHQNGNIPVMVQEFQLQKVDQENETKPPPPPPQKTVELSKVEITRFTPPKIVREVSPEERLPEQDQLPDTKIGAINQDGIKTEFVAPPVEKSTGMVEAPKIPTEDYENEFTTVQVEAKFPGGISGWKKFLERNLVSNVPVEHGALPGKYTVVVSFLVDKNGNISDIQALNDPGFGTAQEAIRVLKKSPKWTPALQNGRNVIYRQKQQITFVVSE